MKTVVSVNEIAEFDIKPRAALAEWKRKVAEEMRALWTDESQWITVACPACSSGDAVAAFEKSRFRYAECSQCKTLYAQTRPSEKALTSWYRQSEAARFWKETLLRETETSRFEKIIEPRSYWILDGISEYMPGRAKSDLRYTDISFFGRALVKKISAEATGLRVVSAGITDGEHPYTQDTITLRTLSSLNAFDELAETDIVVAIDVWERINNLQDFIKQMERVVSKGGLVFATCPVASGFEIQSLWKHSPSVIPPDKLNLPSVQSLLSLFSTSGKWKVLELSTPGMFDVNTVRQTMLEMPDYEWPRPLRALMDPMNSEGIQLFTEYLQSQRLSSFARIVIRKEKD